MQHRPPHAPVACVMRYRCLYESSIITCSPHVDIPHIACPLLSRLLACLLWRRLSFP